MNYIHNPANKGLRALFVNQDLIPQSWQDLLSEQQIDNTRVFNPTLTAVADGYAMCYRVVIPPHVESADEAQPERGELDEIPALVSDSPVRWLATCRLDADFTIVADSVTALSDLVRFAALDAAVKDAELPPVGGEHNSIVRHGALDGCEAVMDDLQLNRRAFTWHADARYFTMGKDLYISWNDGGNTPHNHQFLLKMDKSGTRPDGKARELKIDANTRTTEKNWVFYEHEGQPYCVYSIDPHIVFKVNLDDPLRVICHSPAVSEWKNEYSQFYGVLRGGAQPLLLSDGRLLSIVHSSTKMPQGRSYVAAAYTFMPAPPHNIKTCSRLPHELVNPKGSELSFDKLNRDVFEVVYPSGAVLLGERVLVSYGINDEFCAIAELDLPQLLAEQQGIISTPVMTISDLEAPIENKPMEFGRISPSLPLFWWNALGKKFDSNFGTRKFISGNFGDVASKDIAESISGLQACPPREKERKLVSIGSVLHCARNNDIIWGTGMKGTVRKLDPSIQTLDVYAVRGPLTLNFLREQGIDVSKVTELFDPGCLVGDIYKAEIAAAAAASTKKYGNIRIIPHYRDDLFFHRLYPKLSHHFVSVDRDTLGMVEALAGAEAVYSSSLHGVIFAESMGIPAYWLHSVGGEDGFKFYDYYYGTGRYQVKCHETLHDAMKSTAMPLPNFRFDAYRATFPHQAVTELMRCGIKIGEEIRLSKATENYLTTRFERSTKGMFGKDIWWQTEPVSQYRLQVNGEIGQRINLSLTLRSFATGGSDMDRSLSVRFSNGRQVYLCWPGSDVGDKVLTMPYVLEGAEIDIRFEIEVDNMSRPFRINVDEPLSRIGVGISRIVATAS